MTCRSLPSTRPRASSSTPSSCRASTGAQAVAMRLSFCSRNWSPGLQCAPLTRGEASLRRAGGCF
jgi:hypothetical protein